MGCPVNGAHRIVIREEKRLPFFVAETASFNISLGENANVEKVDGNTIPPSWVESLDALTSFQKKPVFVMVVAKVDSGKTSFCTHPINNLVSAKRNVAFQRRQK